MLRSSSVAVVTACVSLVAANAQAGPIPLDSVLAYSWIQTGTGSFIEQSGYDNPLAQATVNTPAYEEVTATAFQNISGDSGVNVTSSLASGASGQVVGNAQTAASATFVADANTNYTFDFRLSGISLGVSGDHGGSGKPVANPFESASAGTVGARVFFSVDLINLTQMTAIDLFMASLDVWGHGEFDYGLSTFRAREYRLDNQQNMTATMVDTFCLDLDCYGKTVTVDPIQQALNLGMLNVGDTYKLNVVMYSRIAARPYENFAWARIYDPNDISTFSLNATPQTPSVPEPSSMLLMGIALLGGGAGVRRRRQGA